MTLDEIKAKWPNHPDKFEGKTRKPDLTPSAEYLAWLHVEWQKVYAKRLKKKVIKNGGNREMNDARKTIKDIVEEKLQAARNKEYSGQINVRIPKDLHKTLAVEARALNLSLNSIIQIILKEGTRGLND